MSELPPASELIIERPDLQSWRQRFGYGVLTLLCWIAYAYLWLPLVSLLAWYAGWRVFWHQMVELEGYRGLLELLGIYAGVIAAISAVYIGWALVNYWRFHGVERRRARPVVGTEEMAARFGVDARALAAWREARVLVVYHDAAARIERVAVQLPPAPQPVSGQPQREGRRADRRVAGRGS